MARIAGGFLLAAVLVILGCLRTEHKIDMHITLDVRHIQEQAEQVLDYTEGKTDALPGLEAPAATSWLRNAMDALDPMPTAHAQELKSSSPLVKEIADSLRARNGEVSTLKKTGCLGENNRGYVELQDCDGLKDTEKKNAAQKLLADENKDRKALYNEIARLNKDQNVTVSTVESVYALERFGRAGSGERVQLPAAGEMFDKAKASATGKKIGAAAQAGAWVTVP